MTITSEGAIFIVDEDVQDPSPTNPNCLAIIGDISADNFGQQTGFGGFGFAYRVPSTNRWVTSGSGHFDRWANGELALSSAEYWQEFFSRPVGPVHVGEEREGKRHDR